MQFHQSEDSVLAVACEDNRVTHWDLSVEDDQTKTVVNGEEIPPQLMFDHRGMHEPKELAFDKNIKDLVILTGYSGFNVFQPDDVEGD